MVLRTIISWGWSPTLITALAVIGYIYEWPIEILATVLAIIKPRTTSSLKPAEAIARLPATIGITECRFSICFDLAIIFALS